MLVRNVWKTRIFLKWKDSKNDDVDYQIASKNIYFISVDLITILKYFTL